MIQRDEFHAGWKEEPTEEYTHFVSYSGGKDSTAMLIRLLEEKRLPIGKTLIVFADTQYEFKELYEYLKTIEKHIQTYPGFETQKIIILEEYDIATWDQWFYGRLTRGKKKGMYRGMPKLTTPCYWTREAKVKQLFKLREQYPIEEVFIGIAVDEETRYASATIVKEGEEFKVKDGNLRYPLVEWNMTEKQCVTYLQQMRIPSNPLYLNYRRIGCYHCPKQGVSSLFTTWKLYPEKYAEIVHWQKEHRKLMYLNMFEEVILCHYIPLTPYVHNDHFKEHFASLRCYNGDVEELQQKFETGYIPRNKTAVGCWSGCIGVKQAYQELGCGLQMEYERQSELFDFD